jgi:hypothetical protein
MAISKVNLSVKGVDEENKRKAIFVLNTRDSDLSKEIRKMIDELAKEFDEMSK